MSKFRNIISIIKNSRKITAGNIEKAKQAMNISDNIKKAKEKGSILKTMITEDYSIVPNRIKQYLDILRKGALDLSKAANETSIDIEVVKESDKTARTLKTK